MSANAGVDFVENGLILALDAANNRSYPGSGTAWNDLSGNSNNGILTNTPTFDSSNNGFFTFNGSTQYVDSGTNNNLLPTVGLTIGAWIKTSIADKWIVDKAPSAGGQGYVLAGTSTSTFAINVNTASLVSLATYTSNTWRFLCGTWTPSTSLKLYIDGRLDNTNTTSIPASITDPGVNLWIARRRNGADFWNGSIASVIIYSRALSDAEVLQNFNALRGRFGI